MYKVLIRPLQVEDAEVSYNWRNDPEIWKYTGKSPDRVITREIEIEWIRKVLSETDSRRFAIEVDDRYVGNIQITNIRSHLDGQYHIFIGEKEFWGKGIASLATVQIVRFAKEILKLQQVYLYVNPLNTAAIQVYEKCGFIKCSGEVKMVIDLTRSLNPIVSVQMITFNHETFIRRSMESILMQKTNFDFEIIIGEDCSTDDTRSIIQQIADKYPGRFKLLLHKINVGAVANQMSVYQATASKYIALCEGDDYWLDPDKLQKQVDFMEKNPEYGLVYGSVMILTHDGQLYPRPHRKISTYDDLLKLNGIGTATTCFRKSLYDRFIAETSEYANDWIMGDYPFYLWVYQNSKMRGFNEYFAVYLKHEGSSTDFKLFAKGESFLHAVIKIKTHFYSFYKGKAPLHEFLKEEYTSLFNISLQHSKFFKSLRYFIYFPIDNLRFLRKLTKAKLLKKQDLE